MSEKIFLFFLILLSAKFGKSQNTIVLDASKDTYINTVIADQYQGQTQSFIAAAWTYNGSFGQGRSLMGFDLCPLPNNFVLVSATLTLHHDYSANHAGHTTSGLNSGTFYKTTSYWDESTTWSTQPTFDLGVSSNLPASNSSNQDYVIDVTGIVNSSISTSNEVGFYFQLDDEQSYRSLVFASRDHPDSGIRPKLELVYFADTTWCDGPSNPTNPVDSTDFPDSVDICVNDLIVPNVFTPNADLINDGFGIHANCSYSSFHVDITNRWGTLVYSSDDIHFLWKGENETSKNIVSEGTYFYRMVFSQGKQTREKSGFIELIR